MDQDPVKTGYYRAKSAIFAENTDLKGRLFEFSREVL
jgi:hypothetical protein